MLSYVTQMLSYVTRNAELCRPNAELYGPKFYHAQQRKKKKFK